MKRYIFLILLLLLNGCWFNRWNITEINSLQEALNSLKHLNKNALVLFDIDRTLIARNECHNLDSDISAVSAVETITAPIIKELQHRGIKVIALTRGTNNTIPTKYVTGTHGIIESAQDWRYTKLLLVGINFSTSFPISEIVFNQLPIVRGSSHPMFYKGILLTAGNDKGIVLDTFLNFIKWRPSKIVFFDDKKKHLDAVQREMKQRDIPFQGYWYHAGEKLFQKSMYRHNKNN